MLVLLSMPWNMGTLWVIWEMPGTGASGGLGGSSLFPASHLIGRSSTIRLMGVPPPFRGGYILSMGTILRALLGVIWNIHVPWVLTGWNLDYLRCRPDSPALLHLEQVPGV